MSMTTKDSLAMENPEWLSQMETVLEVLNEGVVVIRANHQILFANSQFAEMTGIPRQDLIGFDPSHFYFSPECDLIAQQIEVEFRTTNIVRHSYGNRLDQPIAIYFRRTQRQHDGQVQNGLEILLCDRGPAIDRGQLQGRPLEEIRPGGLGLHFIRHAMDTVEFTRKGSTNRLRLVKYLAPANSAL